MGIDLLASAYIAGNMAQIQLAVAAKLMRMNAQAEASAANLIAAAQDNAAQMANYAAGIGGNLDITV